MADISASVGSSGRNLESDVTNVQTLLNIAPTSQGGPIPVIDIDGWCGKQTNQAITNFQRTQKFAIQDGRVDPGKSTIKRLNELLNGPGTRTVALPDMDPAELARQSVPLALSWANAGLAAIRKALEAVQLSGGLSSLDVVTRTALSGHFKITDGLPKNRLEQLLRVVEKNFVGAIGVLGRAATMFHSVNRKQMSIDFGGGEGAPGYVMPNNRTRINFSPLFHSFHSPAAGPRPGMDWTGPGFGPKCRAAMVLHEPIHIVDSFGGHDIYEHGPQYLIMSPDTAVHNAASYPSFGAHVAENSSLPLGPRYGAGRPAD